MEGGVIGWRWYGERVAGRGLVGYGVWSGFGWGGALVASLECVVKRRSVYVVLGEGPIHWPSLSVECWDEYM